MTRRALQPAQLARHNGSQATEVINDFDTPWRALGYASLECPGTARFGRRLCVLFHGQVYPFTVDEHGAVDMGADVREALRAVCPR